MPFLGDTALGHVSDHVIPRVRTDSLSKGLRGCTLAGRRPRGPPEPAPRALSVTPSARALGCALVLAAPAVCAPRSQAAG